METGTSRPVRMYRLNPQHTAALLHGCRLRTQQQPCPLHMVQRIGQQRIPAHIEIRGSNIKVGTIQKPGSRMRHKPVHSIRHRPAPPVSSKLGLPPVKLPGRIAHVLAHRRKCASTAAWRSE